MKNITPLKLMSYVLYALIITFSAWFLFSEVTCDRFAVGVKVHGETKYLCEDSVTSNRLFATLDAIRSSNNKLSPVSFSREERDSFVNVMKKNGETVEKLETNGFSIVISNYNWLK